MAGGDTPAGPGAGGTTPVDRLVEQGLERYGKGDLDGALLAWENALALRPDEPRALGYVDYVRAHYDLLRGGGGDAALSELAVPCGLESLDDEADYEIEVSGAEPAAPAPPDEARAKVEAYIDHVDDGWFIDDEPAPSQSSRSLPLPPRPGTEAAGAALELEADEPGFGDDDQTREHPAGGRPRRHDDTSEPTVERSGVATGDFDFEGTGDETSAVHRRNLGFVKLSAEPPGAEPEPPAAGFPGRDVATTELRVRFDPRADAEDAKLELEPVAGAPGGDRLDLEPLDGGAGAGLDLEPPSPGAGDRLDLEPLDGGAGDAGEDERTLERGQWARGRTEGERPPTPSPFDQLDLDDGGSPGVPPPVIVENPELAEPAAFDLARRSAPTAEFAPMPTAASTVPRVRRIPAPAAPAPSPAPAPLSAMLAEIDAGAPTDERPDDRTRRRMTALVERAAEATRAGRHAEAVEAVDLALSQDPDSAVAQKLVHRSRDAIVAAYHGFLGDLEIRPSLAMPMHELAQEDLDPRIAFLLSRVDGNLTYEEILDVSGMSRLEALRHLTSLVRRGILR